MTKIQQESGRHGYLTWGADHLNLDAWFTSQDGKGIV